MGAQVNLATPTIPGTNSIVSPYGADIDTSVTGTVRYTEFIPYDSQEMISVSLFIYYMVQDFYFNRARMMVIEWDRVPLRGLSDSANVRVLTHSLY